MPEWPVPVDETDAAVHSAVLSILAADGVEAVSLYAVAARVSIPVADLQRRFPDTAACLTATYDALAAGILTDLTTASADAYSGSDALRRILRALLQRMDGHPGEARLFLQDILRLGREGARHHVAAQRRIADCVFGELAHRTPGRRVDRVQVEMLVGAVFHGLSGMLNATSTGGLVRAEAELAARAHALNPLLV